MSPPGSNGRRRSLRVLLVLLGSIGMFHGSLRAHLNSPHSYFEGNAGPYATIVVVEMPPAVPGEATVQVRLQDRRADEPVEVRVREIPPQGEDRAPSWRLAAKSAQDPDFFTAPVPLMVFGVWKVKVRIAGPRGSGELEIPVAARVPVPRTMSPALGGILGGLLVVLVASMWQMAGGLGREAHLPAGIEPGAKQERRGRILALLTTSGFLVIVAFHLWVWYDMDRFYQSHSKPAVGSRLTVTNPPSRAGVPLSLVLSLTDRRGLPLDGLKPDHGKMMHLLIARLPEADHLLHLHPSLIGPGTFRIDFVPPAPGAYKLFGDFVDAFDIGETVTHVLHVESGAAVGRAFSFADPDDSQSSQPALGSAATLGAQFDLGDGLAMKWRRDGTGPISSGRLVKFVFEMVRTDGGPVEGIEPYMGMAGHLLVMRSDGEVFAHVHPMGTLPGTMMTMAGGAAPTASMDAMHSGMMHTVSPTVSFPYGFPQPGLYRLWVQMKCKGRIHTGVFDVPVD